MTYYITTLITTSHTNPNHINTGYELQPVYRHTFSQYRSKNPGTKVGGPQPDGLTGFNRLVMCTCVYVYVYRCVCVDWMNATALNVIGTYKMIILYI